LVLQTAVFFRIVTHDGDELFFTIISRSLLGKSNFVLCAQLSVLWIEISTMKIEEICSSETFVAYILPQDVGTQMTNIAISYFILFDCFRRNIFRTTISFRVCFTLLYLSTSGDKTGLSDRTLRSGSRPAQRSVALGVQEVAQHSAASHAGDNTVSVTRSQ
jgi:hypothetical protein